MPGTYAPRTAFVNTRPLLIVIIFPTSREAEDFLADINPSNLEHHGQIDERNGHWVVLPAPHGLTRVYTAKRGDIAFEFENHTDADKWNESIKEVGRFYLDTHREYRKRTVYVGEKFDGTLNPYKGGRQ
jgi:hypothetical protein